MILQKFLLRGLLAVAFVLQLTACSRNMHWEEEVLLNTGETITVYKDVRYSVKGQPGNPADLGYVPDWVETTSFKYGGRSYTYTGEAKIMVLAISPHKLPVLLAPASIGDWYYNSNYACVTPYYLQLIPNSTGQQWTWPDRIEKWTYNLPANLMLNRDHPSEVKRRYTMADKEQQTYMRDPQLLDIQKIDPLRKSPRGCFKYTE
jgi:hypothetical protein